jgi:hypothetical protein
MTLTDLRRHIPRWFVHEFEDYMGSKHQQVMVFQLEAGRAGFNKAW